MILGSLRARAPAAFRETEIRSIGYAPNRSALGLGLRRRAYVNRLRQVHHVVKDLAPLPSIVIPGGHRDTWLRYLDPNS